MLVCGRTLAGFAGLILGVSGVALCQDHPSPDALLHQALELHRSGDFAGAIAEYRAYLEQVPDNPMALSNLGAALAHGGDFPEAIVEYRKALELQPANLPVQMNLALAYYKSADISHAAAELERVLGERPGERQPALLLSDCYLRLGENRKAIDLLAPLEQQTPDDKALDYMLGNALIRDGQTARGELLVDRILRDGDSAEAHLLLGESRIWAQDYAGAVTEFQKALAINPQLPSLNGYYGTALANLGETAEAEAALRKELAADANDYAANFQLGKLLMRDDSAQSRAYFVRALGQRPNDFAARYQLALLDLQDSHPEQARAALESLTRENPRDVRAHIALATAYYKLKRKQDVNKQRAIVLELNAEKHAGASGGTSK
ncbi:MAG TPA: tetratricopeptide repeat protein [Bryobacteraceae bacterium]|nr:tetratricopeptide repeat protein [Bryobacteraceae bacterium]